MLSVEANRAPAPVQLRPSPYRQAVGRAMSATLPRRLFMTHGPRAARSICLTFDDGPHPVHTSQILDILRDNHVRATFFVVGRHAQVEPELVRRIIREGHALGHHSFFHGEPAKTSTSQLREEVCKTQAFFAQTVERHSQLFRPPHGKLTLTKLLSLWCAGQSVVLWNRDPKDFGLGSAVRLIDWFKSAQISGGDVVLLHDNLAHTADALADLILLVRSRGLGFTTVESWIGRPATVRAGLASVGEVQS